MCSGGEVWANNVPKELLSSLSRDHDIVLTDSGVLKGTDLSGQTDLQTWIDAEIRTISQIHPPPLERTAVAAIWLRMQKRILTRPENSLANSSHEISNKKLRIKRCEGIR